MLVVLVLVFTPILLVVRCGEKLYDQHEQSTDCLESSDFTAWTAGVQDIGGEAWVCGAMKDLSQPLTAQYRCVRLHPCAGGGK